MSTMNLHYFIVLVIIFSRACGNHFTAEAETINNGWKKAHRHLAQEYFLSYEPFTVVTDQAAIDLDQYLIENLLAQGTDQARFEAYNVYRNGAHSKSFAEITLSEPLSVDIFEGTMVMGLSASGSEVRGTTMVDSQQGDNVVGANPDPVTEGCFADDGVIEIDGFGFFDYSYNMLQENFNARTLQGFSTQAREQMWECQYCPYRTYAKYYQYYGAFDYGDQWVAAAFNGGETNLARGQADFSNYGYEGISEAITLGTVLMNVHMYVIRKLEYAVDQCSGECDIAECNDDAVHSWDEAVAYYTGSIPKTTGKDGTLLYTLAQRRCLNFGTCMREGDDAGMAYANSEIFTQFRTGKMNLMLGNCKDLRMQVDIISQNMAVPLIQGVFRYAHIMDKQLTKTEKAQGEGAAFAASVLPLVYDCSTADAAIIYDNMRVGNQGMADFVLVKQTFERNYDCLGITCEDMGGLIDDVYGGYWEDADPCGQNNSTQLWSPSISFSVDYSTTSAPTAVSTNESSGIIILNNEPDNTISSGSPFVYFPLLNSMALVFTGLLIATL